MESDKYTSKEISRGENALQKIKAGKGDAETDRGRKWHPRWGGVKAKAMRRCLRRDLEETEEQLCRYGGTNGPGRDKGLLQGPGAGAGSTESTREAGGGQSTRSRWVSGYSVAAVSLF